MSCESIVRSKDTGRENNQCSIEIQQLKSTLRFAPGKLRGKLNQGNEDGNKKKYSFWFNKYSIHVEQLLSII